MDKYKKKFNRLAKLNFGRFTQQNVKKLCAYKVDEKALFV